jgi:pimeloyl-ACP methyl ester carboxylesterase
MPVFEHGETAIYYEEHGDGFPLLLIAPGGMNSTIEWWGRAAFNPIETYAADFRLVAMDQRNAGRSTGPLDPEDPWGSFVGDQLGLLDHLGVDSFHVLGCCIGCSYALKLIERAPGRVAAAVLEQPIGIVEDNRELFRGMWREWAGQLVAGRSDLDPAGVEAFGARMWDGDFVLSVPPELVRRCATPLLVLPGIDAFHPNEIGRQVAELAPDAVVVEPWKDTREHVQQAVERVRDFLREHTPAGAPAT